MQGIQRAELVNTVSPGYAQEILRPAAGMGLDKALSALGHRFGGILNGLDMTVWDPATDSALPERYSRSNLAGKAANTVLASHSCVHAITKSSANRIRIASPRNCGFNTVSNHSSNT